MNKEKIKKDLENTLDLISKFNYDCAYSRLFSDFMLRMKKDNSVDDYLMYLAERMLTFAREDESHKHLFLKGNRILRKLAHQIYRDYDDGRKKEGFLTLV